MAGSNERRSSRRCRLMRFSPGPTPITRVPENGPTPSPDLSLKHRGNPGKRFNPPSSWASAGSLRVRAWLNCSLRGAGAQSPPAPRAFYLTGPGVGRRIPRAHRLLAESDDRPDPRGSGRNVAHRAARPESGRTRPPPNATPQPVACRTSWLATSHAPVSTDSSPGPGLGQSISHAHRPMAGVRGRSHR